MNKTHHLLASNRKYLKDTERVDPYLRGYRSGKHGQKITVNPFYREDEDSQDRRRLWDLGWHEGRKEFLG